MTCSFPLRYAHANVLLGRGGEAAGLYRLGMSTYPFLPAGGKWALARRLQRLAHTIAADFSLWRVCRAYPAHRYVQRTTGLLDERHQDPEVWQAFLQGHEQRLKELGSHVPEVYLAVSLGQSAPKGVGSGLVRSVDRVRRRVEELAGIADASPIPASHLQELSVVEQRVYQRLRGVAQTPPATTGELQWLLRRAACRGVAEPDLDSYWEPDALIISAPGGRGSRCWRCCPASMRSPEERTICGSPGSRSAEWGSSAQTCRGGEDALTPGSPRADSRHEGAGSSVQVRSRGS
jgi:hypothetical protein